MPPQIAAALVSSRRFHFVTRPPDSRRQALRHFTQPASVIATPDFW